MVKCAECGYLGVRGCKDLALVSPDEEQRRTGNASKGADRVPILRTMPVCAIGANLLHEEFYQEKLVGPSSNRVSDREEVTGGEQARLVLQKERDCEKSTNWIPGLSPKEHIDMNLLEQAKLREDDRTKRQQEWQERQLERGRKWREEDLQRERQWRQEDIRRTKWDIAVKVIGPVAAAIVGVIIGWLLHPTVTP